MMPNIERRIIRLEQRMNQQQGRCYLWEPDADDGEGMAEYRRRLEDAQARGEQVFVFRWQGL